MAAFRAGLVDAIAIGQTLTAESLNDIDPNLAGVYFGSFIPSLRAGVLALDSKDQVDEIAARVLAEDWTAWNAIHGPEILKRLMGKYGSKEVSDLLPAMIVPAPDSRRR
ncbi:MAG: hypothetical protein Q8O67_20865 [Deltaproteobacteria bacterium]|nr:hypothetical protein [Deltaproteobacteria bacterium]